MRIFIILSLAIISTTQCIAEESPRDFADRFYQAWSKWEIPGVPYPEHEQHLSSYLGMELIRAFRKINIQRERWDKKYPPDSNPLYRMKPPWTPQGDLFSSLYEGFTAYSIGEARVLNGRMVVDVHMEWHVHKWTDRLILDRAGSNWVIANLKYKEGTFLLKVLEEEISLFDGYLKAGRG